MKCFSFMLGNISCLAVNDVSTQATYPVSLYDFPASYGEIEKALRAYKMTPERIPCDWICLLMEVGGKRLLVDAGHGPGFGQGAGELIKHLQQAGISTDMIDAVIPTHVHDDHIAGLLNEDGRCAFPNAHLYLGRLEWETWEARINLPRINLTTGEMEFLKAADKYLPPLVHRMELVDDGQEILPGVKVVLAPGHTPGHLVIHISSVGDQLLHCGDLVYTPVQVDHPEWYTPLDYDREQVIATRKLIFEHAAIEHILITASHFPMPGIGYVVTGVEGWHWQAESASMSSS